MEIIKQKEELKQQLHEILKDVNKLNQYNNFKLAKDALIYIGDTDSELRDDLVLTYLENLLSNQLLSNDEVIYLLNQCLINIFEGIGEKADSVFKRTFSMLFIAIAMNLHRVNHYLEKEKVLEIFDQVIKSYINDIDVRGYIEDKGWAHQAAHGADALNVFVYLLEADSEIVKKIMDAIYQKSSIDYYGYIHNEDDRMARVIISIINSNKIDQEQIIEWFNRYLLIKEKGIGFIIKRNNVRNFLRSIYFRLIKNNENNVYTNLILEILEKNQNLR